jgi:aminopeptidase-like protein
MANNELSGPVVTTELVKWLMERKRKYTYRIVFIPETIGSIVYLSRNIEIMKKNIKAGFNISCVGDDRIYSYLPSRKGDELIDKCIKHVLGHVYPNYIEYSWLDRGSDERQYNAPLVDLPVASLMRSKYSTYPEYHTSLDNLDLISPSGLYGSFQAIKKCIMILENNEFYQVNVLGEPQLGKRGLYSNLSMKGSAFSSKILTNFISYCDGSKDLLSIADIIGQPAWELIDIAKLLVEHGLISIYK